MKTKEEILKFIKDSEEFTKECNRVVKASGRTEYEHYSIQGNNVHCGRWNKDGEYETWCFDLYYLSLSDYDIREVFEEPALRTAEFLKDYEKYRKFLDNNRGKNI